jgi:hypothetical protein
MSKLAAISSVVVLAAISGSAFAQFNPVNNSVATRGSLGIGSSLVPLDISGLGYLNGVINDGTNAYIQNYTGAGSNFTGTLRAEVFGNVSLPNSASLNDVMIVYTFVGNVAPVGSETFDFGVDSSTQIDFSRLAAATHGRIDADTAVEVGQLDPVVTLFDNVGSNDTFFFNWNSAGGSSSVNRLGGSQAEVFTWYVRTTGDVKLNFVDVRITDFGSVTIRSLALVDNPGQPDLNVPAPGVATLLVSAFGVMGMRRRRA